MHWASSQRRRDGDSAPSVAESGIFAALNRPFKAVVEMHAADVSAGVDGLTETPADIDDVALGHAVK